MHKVLFSLLIVFVFASAFCGCVSAGDTWNGIELNWTWYSDDANDYYIYDAGSLAALSEKTSYNSSKNETFKGKTIHLMNNINLSSICNASTDTSWIPIGTKSEKFSGNFEGNGKTISNLYINKPSDNFQGLFGYIYSTSNITNLTLTNVNVTGKDNVGGLVGFYQCDNAKTYFIDNCSVSGNISGVRVIGGLIGVNYVGIIKNCSSTVKVTGSDEQIGGLIGCNGGTIIENCYANAEVSGVNSNVGGLVGYNNLNMMNIIKSCIKNCFASGNVSGKDNVGGLVGHNTITAKDGKLTISNCYANAEVSGKDKVGGLIGYNSLGSAYDASYSIIIIENTYATCNVSGNDYVGGLIGQNDFMKKSCSKLYINNSVALNKYVNSKPKPIFNSVGRIAGYSNNDHTCTFSLNNNYGWKFIKNVKKTFSTENKLNQKNGKDVSDKKEVWCKKSFFENKLNWDFHNTWAIESADDGTCYPLPYLKSLGKDDSLREKVIYLMPDYEVSVKFDKNGGAGTMPVQTFKYGVPKNLYPNTFTKDDWIFAGWNTKEDGSGKNYKDEDSIIITAETTLYAVWTKITNVTLYFNNTTSSIENQVVNISYDSGEFNKTLIKPIYKGHTFLGYNNSSNGGVRVINENLELMSNVPDYTDDDGKWINESNDVKLWAVWKQNVTNVTLHFNNFTTDKAKIINISYDNNTFNETLTTPSYAGHTFLGYFNESSGGVLIINTTLLLEYNIQGYTNETGYWNNNSTDINLYAQWKTNVTNVTLHFNNSTTCGTQIVNISYDNNTFNQSLTIPIYAGHTFLGYNSTKVGGVQVINKDRKLLKEVSGYTNETGYWINESSNVELWAAWSVNSYNVTFNSNNETPVNVNQTVSYGVGTPLNKFDTLGFSKAGHTFIGWNNSSPPGNIVNYEDGSSITIYKDTVLYAVWKANTTQITLHFNNSTDKSETTAIDYNSTEFNLTSHPSPIHPEWKGHTFLGYNSTKDGGVQVIGSNLDILKGVSGYTDESGQWNNDSSTIDLWALWKANTTQITLHFNNLTEGSETVAIDYNATDYNGTKPTCPEWTGHTFLGYNSTKDGGVQVIGSDLKLLKGVSDYTDGDGKWINESSTIDLWALWKANTYNVTFNANGGTGSMYNQSFTHGVEQELSENTFTKTGYTFIGWNNTTSPVTKPVYKDKESITITEDVTLYAMWETTPTPASSSTSSTTYTGWVIYTVYFDSCGGSHIDNQTNLRYGEKVKKPDDPTRDGYIFDGWYTADSYKWDFKNDTLNQSFTLYAKWKLIEVPLSPTVKQHHGCWIAIIILLITAAVITAVIIKKKHDKKKDEENYDILS